MEPPTLPPIRQLPVSVVAPSLEGVAGWLPFVDNAPAGSEVIVVVDGDLGECPQHPRLRVIRHAQPLGLGACVQTALWSVETPLVLFVADSVSPAQAAEFFARIDEAHLVAGCRNVRPIPIDVRVRDVAKSIACRVLLGHAPPPRSAWPGRPSWRRRLARNIFGVPLLDPESGVLLVRTEVVRDVPIQSHGSFVWNELLAKANHLGCLIDEIAIGVAPPPSDAFGRDAWRLFRHPEFGPVGQAFQPDMNPRKTSGSKA